MNSCYDERRDNTKQFIDCWRKWLCGSAIIGDDMTIRISFQTYNNNTNGHFSWKCDNDVALEGGWKGRATGKMKRNEYQRVRERERDRVKKIEAKKFCRRCATVDDNGDDDDGCRVLNKVSKWTLYGAMHVCERPNKWGRVVVSIVPVKLVISSLLGPSFMHFVFCHSEWVERTKQKNKKKKKNMKFCSSS